MSILTDLRAALEAKEEAARLFDSLSDLTATEGDLNCLLTDDTIRALFDVAEAMDAENNSSGEAARQAYVRGRIALAPLVKEVDHDRA